MTVPTGWSISSMFSYFYCSSTGLFLSFSDEVAGYAVKLKTNYSADFEDTERLFIEMWEKAESHLWGCRPIPGC